MDSRVPCEGCRAPLTLVLQEVARGLPVKLGQLQKLDDVDATIPGLTLRQKRMREAETLGNLTLI